MTHKKFETTGTFTPPSADQDKPVLVHLLGVGGGSTGGRAEPIVAEAVKDGEKVTIVSIRAAGETKQ